MTDQTPPEQGPTAPAGWYPHPTMVDTQRYWDGEAWTDHLAPATASPAVPKSSPGELDKILIAVGLVSAVILPCVGLIIGIVLLVRNHGAGLWCILLAIVSFLVWAALLSSNSTSFG